jgi:hypothetical protein
MLSKDDVIADFLRLYTTPDAIKAHSSGVKLESKTQFYDCFLISIAQIDSPAFYLKVSSKDAPSGQVANEVGALRYIRRLAGLPATPRVLAFVTSGPSPYLCFEAMRGKNLRVLWHQLPQFEKKCIIQKLAMTCKILNRYESKSGMICGFNEQALPGPIVEACMGQGRQHLQPLNRGPYTDIESYLQAHVDKEILYSQSTPQAIAGQRPSPLYCTNDDGIDDSSSDCDFVCIPTTTDCLRKDRIHSLYLAFLESLKARVPCFFDQPVSNNTREKTAVLSYGAVLPIDAILVDPLTHDITGVLHWQFAGFVPRAFSYSDLDLLDSNLEGRQAVLTDELYRRYAKIQPTVPLTKEDDGVLAACLEPDDSLWKFFLSGMPEDDEDLFGVMSEDEFSSDSE